MRVEFQRTLRTSSSERYLLAVDDRTDSGTVELHFPADGSVQGTVTLLEPQLSSENAVSELLRLIDEKLLPMVEFDQNNLSFTVVTGRVIGTYIADKRS